MIYTLGTIELVPGKFSEYSEIASKEILPVQTKLGMKLVGSFHAYTGNMNNLFMFYEYKDLADMYRIRAGLNQSKEYVQAMDKTSPLRMSWDITIIEPNPWSPMK